MDPIAIPDPFWLDTYFDNETEEYRFSHSNDLISEFDFIEPMVGLFSNRKIKTYQIDNIKKENLTTCDCII